MDTDVGKSFMLSKCGFKTGNDIIRELLQRFDYSNFNTGNRLMITH